MQKTTNYQLNQWDSGDRILREDFNQDNKKLDDAIAALRDASPLVKLRDVTLQSAQSQVEISLDGLDLTPYRELWIYSRFSASTAVDSYVYFTVNDLTKYTDTSTTNWSSLATINLAEPVEKIFSCITVLLGGVLAASHTYTYIYGSDTNTSISSWRNAALSAEELTKMTFACTEGLLGAGTRISILGLRV